MSHEMQVMRRSGDGEWTREDCITLLLKIEMFHFQGHFENLLRRLQQDDLISEDDKNLFTKRQNMDEHLVINKLREIFTNTRILETLKGKPWFSTMNGIIKMLVYHCSEILPLGVLFVLNLWDDIFGGHKEKLKEALIRHMKNGEFSVNNLAEFLYSACENENTLTKLKDCVNAAETSGTVNAIGKFNNGVKVYFKCVPAFKEHPKSVKVKILCDDPWCRIQNPDLSLKKSTSSKWVAETQIPYGKEIRYFYTFHFGDVVFTSDNLTIQKTECEEVTLLDPIYPYGECNVVCHPECKIVLEFLPQTPDAKSIVHWMKEMRRHGNIRKEIVKSLQFLLVKDFIREDAESVKIGISMIFAHEIDVSQCGDDVEMLYDCLTIQIEPEDPGLYLKEVLKTCKITLENCIDTLKLIIKYGADNGKLTWLSVLPLYWLMKMNGKGTSPGGRCFQKFIPLMNGYDWSKLEPKIQASYGGVNHKSEHTLLFKSLTPLAKNYPLMKHAIAYFTSKLHHSKDVTWLTPFLVLDSTDGPMKKKYMDRVEKRKDKLRTERGLKKVQRYCEDTIIDLKGCKEKIDRSQDGDCHKIRHYLDISVAASSFLEYIKKLSEGKSGLHDFGAADDSLRSTLEELLKTTTRVLQEISNSRRDLDSSFVQFWNGVFNLEWSDECFRAEWRQDMGKIFNGLHEKKWSHKVDIIYLEALQDVQNMCEELYCAAKISLKNWELIANHTSKDINTLRNIEKVVRVAMDIITERLQNGSVGLIDIFDVAVWKVIERNHALNKTSEEYASLREVLTKKITKSKNELDDGSCKVEEFRKLKKIKDCSASLQAFLSAEIGHDKSDGTSIDPMKEMDSLINSIDNNINEYQSWVECMEIHQGLQKMHESVFKKPPKSLEAVTMKDVQEVNSNQGKKYKKTAYNELKDWDYFIRIYEMEAQKIAANVPDAYDMWMKAKLKLDSVYHEMQSGNLKLKTVFHCFPAVVKVEKDLTKMFQIYGELTDVELVDSIEFALRVNKKQDIIKEILELLQKILNMDISFLSKQWLLSGEENLAEVTERVEFYKRYFRVFTKTLLNGLQKYSEGSVMIKWIKKYIRGTSQLMILLDLCLPDLNNKETAKFTNFVNAVMGFAPLLFPHQAYQANELMDILQKISEDMENGNLNENWKESLCNSDWLLSQCKKYGEEETVRSGAVKHINECGIYHIECKESDLKKLSAKDCLWLEVPIQNKRYSLDELKDLQANATLVHGKGDELGVEKFCKLLDTVTDIAQIWLKLVNNACMLFVQWTLALRSAAHTQGVTEEYCLEMSFNNETSKFISSCSLENIQEFSRALSEASKKHSEYLDQARDRHYYLNEFTDQQLLFLCKNLARLQNGKVSPRRQQFYDLLFPITIDLRRQWLMDCLEEAMKSNDKGIEKAIRHSMDAGKKTDEKSVIIDILVEKHGAGLKAAQAAVQAKGALGQKACYQWYLKNKRNEKLINDLHEDYLKEKDDEGCQYYDDEKGTIKDTMKKILDDPRIENWRRPVVAVDIAIKKYHHDTLELSPYDSYSSIEVLGKFLGFLSRKNCQPKRSLPRSMKEGQMNLVTCKSNDCLATVMSIYMSNNSLSLPTASEVLLCSRNTTDDDLNRFLRRAMLSKDTGSEKCLYCLAHAETLQFSQVRCIEKRHNSILEKKPRGFNANYQLVILSNQPKGYLARVYAQHKMPSDEILKKDEEIQSYVEEKLKMDSSVLLEDIKLVEGIENCSVRIIKSKRAGEGKSLCIKRMEEKLGEKLQSKNGTKNVISIFLHESYINIDDFVMEVTKRLPRNIHTASKEIFLMSIEITTVDTINLDELLFQLFILGKIERNGGTVLMRKENHIYAVEMPAEGDFQKLHCWLPNVACATPGVSSKEVKEFYWDKEEYKSEYFMRPYTYLKVFSKSPAKLHKTTYKAGQKIPPFEKFLKVYVDQCKIPNPTWAQLSYFAKFLNYQLKSCENSIYVAKSGHSSLKQFALKWLITTAKELADASLVKEGSVLEQHQMTRTWKDSKQSLFFFNDDEGGSMQFLNIKPNEVGNSGLRQALERSGYFKNNTLESMDRPECLQVLRQLMDIRDEHDPDPTFELTPDNVLKIIAIHTRLQCEIPLVVMGETGSGKTRMIEFICKMKAGSKQVDNMFTMKIHGGVTKAHIYDKVERAKKQAAELKHMKTILFFDESNTTEAVHVVKEVMCDRRLRGRPLDAPNLQFVSACNPYRKMSDVEIEKIQRSGLGYAAGIESTAEKLGGISMRDLVYRVVPLPPSMKQLVWDFGQLSKDDEKKYIRRKIESLEISALEDDAQHADFIADSDQITDIISNIQEHMRSLQNECKFVSLRDVERFVKVYEWLHSFLRNIGAKWQEKFCHKIRTFIHAISICYYVSVEDKETFLEEFTNNLKTLKGCEGVTRHMIDREIRNFQNMFTEGIDIDKDITITEALTENIFMMAVCVTLKIPLFIVGKPGSSKSLAKSILRNVMRGSLSASNHPIWSNLSYVYLTSFQCSRHTDADGICDIFTKSRNMQDMQGFKDKYTVAVVLDEIGLAEASIKMPLKVLHPLLDGEVLHDRNDGEANEVTEHSRAEERVQHKASESATPIGFIGISNWALDPSKMNRAIFLRRLKPSSRDMKSVARHIFDENHGKSLGMDALVRNHKIVELLAEGYMKLTRRLEEIGYEFFGLRDFYHLIRMVGKDCGEGKLISKQCVVRAILRNFSGSKQQEVVQTIFAETLWDNISAFMMEGMDDYGQDDNDDIFFEFMNPPNFRDYVMITDDESSLTSLSTSESLPIPETIRHDSAEVQSPGFNQASNVESRPASSRNSIDKCCSALAENSIGNFDSQAEYASEWTNKNMSSSDQLVENTVKEGLKDERSRYLLLMTNSLSNVWLLEKIIPNLVVIFGSTFPEDHTYYNICRHINSIKNCMESGKTIVLVNQAILHESLYEVLNQQYVEFLNQRFVDIGVEGYIAKCCVSKDFRVLILEKRKVVYDQYPIPLLSRMEKHNFSPLGLASVNKFGELQKHVIEWLKKLRRFTRDKNEGNQNDSRNLLVAKNEDTLSTLTCIHDGNKDKIKEELTGMMSIDVATRIAYGNSPTEDSSLTKQFRDTYFGCQSHESLQQFLLSKLKKESGRELFEIITFDNMITERDRSRFTEALKNEFGMTKKLKVRIISLHEIRKAEQLDQIFESFFQSASAENGSILLIQCHYADEISRHLEYAKFSFINKKRKQKRLKNLKAIAAFIIYAERHEIERNPLFTLQPTDFSEIVYVDSVRPLYENSLLPRKAVTSSFEDAVKTLTDEDLASCVGAAIAAISKSRFVKNTERYRRVLDGHFLTKTVFWKFLKKKISEFKEKKNFSSSRAKGTYWALEVAKTKSWLLEGGSFCNALQIRLKDLVADALARMITTLDKNENLQLLEREHDIWLNFFADFKNTDELSMSINVNVSFNAQFPFSFWVASLTEEQIASYSSFNTLLGIGKDDKITSFVCDIIMINYGQRCLEKNGESKVKKIHELVISLLQQEKLEEGHTIRDMVLATKKIIQNHEEHFNLFFDVIEIFPDIADEVDFTEGGEDLIAKTLHEISNFMDSSAYEVNSTITTQLYELGERIRALGSDEARQRLNSILFFHKIAQTLSIEKYEDTCHDIICEHSYDIKGLYMEFYESVDEFVPLFLGTMTSCYQRLREVIFGDQTAEQINSQLKEKFSCCFYDVFAGILRNGCADSTVAEVFVHILVLLQPDEEYSLDSLDMNISVRSRFLKIIMTNSDEEIQKIVKKLLNNFLTIDGTQDEHQCILVILHYLEEKSTDEYSSLKQKRGENLLELVRQLLESEDRSPYAILQHVSTIKIVINQLIMQASSYDDLDFKAILQCLTELKEESELFKQYFAKVIFQIQGKEWLKVFLDFTQASGLSFSESMHLFAQGTTDYSFLYGNHSIITGLLTSKKLPHFSPEDSWEANLNQLLKGFLIAISSHHSFYSFQRLVTNPDACSSLFFPGMPEDICYNMNNQADRVAIYMCPNRHPYGIGDCTRPWKFSKCSVCGAIIGGLLHRLAPGNQRVPPLDPSSSCGYSVAINHICMKQLRVSQKVESILQLMLHMSLWLSHENHPDAVARIVKKPTNGEIGTYLKEQIAFYLRRVQMDISLNSDDTLLLMHLLFKQIYEARNQANSEWTAEWNTLEKRSIWEKSFVREIFTPIFSDIDGFIRNARQEYSTNPPEVLTILHDAPSGEESDASTWKHRRYWHFIKQPSMNHLISVSGGKCDFLNADSVKHLKYLKPVVKVQKYFMERFRYVRETEVERIPLNGNMEEVAGDVDKYMEIWNKTYMDIQKRFSGQGRPQDFKPMDQNSKLAMVLPCSRGRGLCAKLLRQYLIEKHNKFLERIGNEVLKVKLNELKASHYIDFDENGVQSLLRKICHYKIRNTANGSEHIITYDVNSVMTEVKDKRQIDIQDLPVMQYYQEVGIGKQWEEMEEKYRPQERLNNEVLEELENLLKNASLSDICAGVRLMSNTISLLMLKEKDEMKTDDYICEFIDNSRSLQGGEKVIPPSARIKHALAVYLHLTLVKSIIWVEAERGLWEVYIRNSRARDEYTPATDETWDALRGVLSGSNQHEINSLVKCLNELALRRYSDEDFQPFWDLESCMIDFSFLETVVPENETASWLCDVLRNIPFGEILKALSEAIKVLQEKKQKSSQEDS